MPCFHLKKVLDALQNQGVEVFNGDHAESQATLYCKACDFEWELIRSGDVDERYAWELNGHVFCWKCAKKLGLPSQPIPEGTATYCRGC